MVTPTFNMRDIAKKAAEKEGDCCDKTDPSYSNGTIRNASLNSRKHMSIEASL